MSGEAKALIESLDASGASYLLGWLSSALDSGGDFTADDLVTAVAAYRRSAAAS